MLEMSLRVKRWLVVLAHLYCLAVCLWAALYWIFADRWWWLFLLNTFALYFFAPLPLLLALTLWLRRRELWLGLILVLALGVYFYADVFQSSPAACSSSSLSVMTFNVLGYNELAAPLLAALTASDADVIALQELNPQAAEAIQSKLRAEYPYQVLQPQPGTAGMGVISRYPLRSLEATLPGYWVGPPQVLEMDWQGKVIVLLNFHAIPPSGRFLFNSWSVRERERQMRAVAAFGADCARPLVVMGDLNAAERSAAYAIVTGELVDAWRVAGRGLGHTFPGALSKGSSRPNLFGIVTVPKWLVRIDYVFHSTDWQTLTSQIGPWDGYSDHRPVKAELVLLPDLAAIVEPAGK